MKIRITLTSIKKLMLTAACLFSFLGFAQLSGTYTINGATVTGGTNYQTFGDAVTALTTSGVNGAVLFNVAAGTYTEQNIIQAITGASATNTITFKGLGSSTKLTAAGTSTNNAVLSLDSAQYINIEDLFIEATGFGWGIHFATHTEHVNITGCYIKAPADLLSYCIFGSESVTSTSKTVNNAEYVAITNNTLEGGRIGVKFSGMTSPLTIPNKQVNYGTDITITDNTIIDYNQKGVEVNYYHNVIVSNNLISSSESAVNGAVSFWDAGDELVITGNDIYAASNVSNTRLIIVAMAPPNGPAGDVTKPCIIANNFIQYEGTNSTGPTGLLLKNKAHIKVYNNSFKIKNQGSAANCIWLDNNNARPLDGIEIRNNVMVLENSGSGQFLYTANSTLGARFKNVVLDHNAYYAPSGYFKSVVANGTGITTFLSFAVYQANTNGWGVGALNVDPMFVSATDLHATAVAMNDSAAVISSITTDIDGDVRSLTNPDIGADEYMPPTCLSSSNLTATNVFGTTADVYWTQSNLGSIFKMEYGVSGFTLGQGTSLIPTNDTVVLTGLTAQTTYDVYVKEICSATDSSAWTSISFTTTCGLISTFPYTESFEGTGWVGGTGSTNASSAINQCWSRTPASGFFWGTHSGSTTSGSTGPTNGFGGSGNYIYTESSSGSTGSTADFTSPSFDLSSLNVPQISFQYHMYGAAMGSLSLWIWNGSQYDTLLTLTGNLGNGWQETVVDLSAYANATVHFVFQAKRGTSFTSDMAIDEVKINEAPPCPKPSVVFANNPTSSSFAVNFTSSGTSFPIEYGPAGFSQGTGLTDTATATGHLITGLTSNTAYDFYIMNDCTDSLNGLSVWVGPFTITTLCGYTNAYFNDWDGLSSNTSDPCWTYINYGSPSNYGRAYAPSSTLTPQPHSAPNYYRFYTLTQGLIYFVSPEITDLSLNNLQLRFQGIDTYTGTVFAPEFYVGTMSSLSDTSTFVALDTLITTTNSWTEFTVVLNNIPANHKFVVIRHGGKAASAYMGIDDLYIETQPACIPPSNGTFTGTTDTSTILTWNAGDGSTFEIEYGLAGYSQGTGTVVSGITSITDTLNGLLPNTCYDMYIRGNCAVNNSPWYGPVTVCTECAIVTAPFFEDFDGASWVDGSTSNNLIDPCWARTPLATNVFRWETDSSTTTSGSTGPSSDFSGTGKYVYAEASNGSTGNLASLTTPIIDFSGLTTPTLSFAYHMHGLAMGDLYVLVSNNNSSYDTLEVLSGPHQSSETDPWKMRYVNLDTYKSMPRSIQFMAKRGTSFTSDMAIDEISVDEMPTCLTPTNFALDTVTSTTADFSWNSISNGTAFKVEYGPVGFGQGSGAGTTVYTSGSPTTVTGLTPNTSYDIYITDLCDSTNWVGPITFTTLVEDDAELLSLVSPQNLFCGDSTLVIEIEVQNNGLNPISSLPVGATISGAVTANINSVYTNTIAPGATAIVAVGTVNSYKGGTINIEAFTNLTGDQATNNDTLVTNGIELISAVPLHLPVDTLCANDTTGMFVALPQTGISYNWYNNMADVIPFATGDTVSAMPNQTVYLDRSQEGSIVIQTGTSGSLFGSMFKLYVKNDFVFSGYTWISHQGGLKSLKAFYKMGDYEGHETTRSSWTVIDTLEQTSSTGLTPYRFDFTTPVTFFAGDTISIYLASKAGKYESQGLPNATVDSVYKTTNEFEYIAGIGGAYFGSNMIGATSASSIALTLHWESLDVCGNNRIALTMGVNNDSAVADFTHVLNPNGADVMFDGSASVGQTYDWDFGDGTTATGMTTTHTYTNGTYTAKLVVTDSVCGTMDSMEVVINATVGLAESLLGRTFKVYPNPNNGKFRVAFEMEGIKDVNVTITDELGRVIYTDDLGNVTGAYQGEIDLTNHAKGVYFIRLTVNGESVFKKISVLF